MPGDDQQLPDLFVRLRNDPANADATRNLTFGTRGILDRPFESAKPTCNQCLIVCSGPLEDRKRLMNLLFSSGVVELDEQGQEIVIRPEEKELLRGSAR